MRQTAKHMLWLSVAGLLALEVFSANLVENYGLEEPFLISGPASNWWYYADCARAAWAKMPPMNMYTDVVNSVGPVFYRVRVVP